MANSKLFLVLNIVIILLLCVQYCVAESPFCRAGADLQNVELKLGPGEQFATATIPANLIATTQHKGETHKAVSLRVLRKVKDWYEVTFLPEQYANERLYVQESKIRPKFYSVDDAKSASSSNPFVFRECNLSQAQNVHAE